MKTITAKELQDLIKIKPSLLLVDVRETSEWQSQHVESSINLPLSDSQGIHAFLKSKNKSEEIFIMCQRGGRSFSFATFLNENGYTNITNVEGGLDSWLLAEKGI